MTWVKISERVPADEDAMTFMFYQSDRGPEHDFITPERKSFFGWMRHSHPGNEIMATHWWDGDAIPSAPPVLADGEHRPLRVKA